jgi:cell division septum initiation protein DivIVA
MRRMGIYDQIETAFQDLVAPALPEIKGEIYSLRAELEGVRSDVRRVDSKVDSLQAQMGSMKNELVSEIRRVDVRIDAVERELRIAIDIRERLAALQARRA